MSKTGAPCDIRRRHLSDDEACEPGSAGRSVWPLIVGRSPSRWHRRQNFVAGTVRVGSLQHQPVDPRGCTARLFGGLFAELLAGLSPPVVSSLILKCREGRASVAVGVHIRVWRCGRIAWPTVVTVLSIVLRGRSGSDWSIVSIPGAMWRLPTAVGERCGAGDRRMSSGPDIVDVGRTVGCGKTVAQGRSERRGAAAPVRGSPVSRPFV